MSPPPGEERPPAAGPTTVSMGPGLRDRVLLWLFLAYAALLAVAAFAQLTGNRALLDLFDFRRFFTR